MGKNGVREKGKMEKMGSGFAYGKKWGHRKKWGQALHMCIYVYLFVAVG
jgi:hypothetical protein